MTKKYRVEFRFNSMGRFVHDLNIIILGQNSNTISRVDIEMGSLINILSLLLLKLPKTETVSITLQWMFLASTKTSDTHS